MSGINVGRWLAAGLVAAAVIFVLEGVASTLYMADMRTALQAHGLDMEMTPAVWGLAVLACLLVGLVLMFFYAAARPRFGAGPRTAVIVALALWLGSYLVSLIGYQMVGLYRSGLLVTWGLIGLVELIVAGLVGGWIYREGATS